MRSTPLIKIEKQPIYFAIRKVISPRFYKNKIKSKSITKDQAIEQISEILDIAIMIRYQDTESLESILRGIDNGDNVIDIFKDKIELIGSDGDGSPNVAIKQIIGPLFFGVFIIPLLYILKEFYQK